MFSSILMDRQRIVAETVCKNAYGTSLKCRASTLFYARDALMQVGTTDAITLDDVLGYFELALIDLSAAPAMRGPTVDAVETGIIKLTTVSSWRLHDAQ